MDEERQNNKYFVPSNTSTPWEETKASNADDVSISPIDKPANENQGGGKEVSDVAEINPSTSSLPTTSRSHNESDVVKAPTSKRKHRKPLESLWENVDLTNLSKETKDEFDDLHSSKELSSTIPVKKEKTGFQIFHDSAEDTDQADSHKKHAERSKKKKKAFFHLLELSNRDENDHGTVQHTPSGQDSLDLATGQAGVNGFNVWHDSSEETDQTETPVLKIKHRKPLKVLFQNKDYSQEHPEKSEQSSFEIWQDALEETECQQSGAVGTTMSNVAGGGDPTLVIPSTSGMHTRSENKECQQSGAVGTTMSNVAGGGDPTLVIPSTSGMHTRSENQECQQSDEVVTSNVTGISGGGFLVWHDSFQGDDQADESAQDSEIPSTSSSPKNSPKKEDKA